MENGFFGSAAQIRAANSEPPEIENEVELLAQLRAKTGPHADEQRLLYHIRAASGKLHWAVNSYLREVFMLSEGGAVPDFAAPHAIIAPLGPVLLPSSMANDAGNSSLNPEPYPSTRDCPADPGPPVSPAALSVSGGSLECFPASLLEELLMHLDAWSVCQAAKGSRAFKKATSSNRVWEKLFKTSPWGDTVFPTEPHLNNLWQAPNTEPPPPPPQQQQQHLFTTTAIAVSQHGPVSGEVLPLGESSMAESFLARGMGGHRSQELGFSLGQHEVACSESPAAGTTASAAQPSSAPTEGGDSPRQEQQQQRQLACSGDDHWRELFRKQAAFEFTRTCPRCGGLRLLPVLYGYPSVKLLTALREKRLLLGGDHLIEDCHVWACTTCNSSFRTYPYHSPKLWMAEVVQHQSCMAGLHHGRRLPYEL